MNSPDDRAAELIAAAVAGALTPAESAEFDDLRRREPWIDDEVASLRALTGELDGVSWTPSEPDGSLRDRVASISLHEATDAPAPMTELRPRPRRWVLPALGAACLALGLVLGVALPSFNTTPSGPPGTLGAVEPVDVSDGPEGTTIDADLVAHTWGTEAIVDAAGLEVGATYAVVLVASDGTEYSAGAMLGSAVPIHCSVNAAVLREDVARLEIRDAGSGVVAAADLPEV
ncbi:hypothetical protein ACFXP7_08605 [Microbacterium sp. P06]|uniref:hypothetical protein n=1 Tax=Microbacterium sp. P06 TaxID=3366949 RepID=UPI003747674C